MNPAPEPEVSIGITYIIASTMRTGSYLLCEGLEATGVAGRPREIFCPERRRDYEGRWHLPANESFSQYMRTALCKSTTDNGVCGMKIHWHHVEPLALVRGGVGKPWRILPRLFPDARYIYLCRRDRRAQAISWYRAQVTNEWYRIKGEVQTDLTGVVPEIDTAKLRQMELELESQDERWQEFFATQPVPALPMVYEALAADYRGEIARALSFLDQDPALAQDIPEPRLVCQNDEMTAEWHRRMDEAYPPVL